MAGENQSGMQCVEVEALLAEALDGTLHGSQLAAFEAHQQGCPACRTLVAEAGAGMHWLKGLDEAEPPRNLVHNILAQTIGALPSEHIVPVQRGEGWLEKLKGRLAPLFGPVATPANTGATRPFSLSSHPSPRGLTTACSDGSAPIVCARMLCTRLRGGSASSRPCSQCIPARASSTRQRQVAQSC